MSQIGEVSFIKARSLQRLAERIIIMIMNFMHSSYCRSGFNCELRESPALAINRFANINVHVYEVDHRICNLA